MTELLQSGTEIVLQIGHQKLIEHSSQLIMINSLLFIRSGAILIHFCLILVFAAPVWAVRVKDLAYIFYFNAEDNPINFIYATMTILVINTIVHFYTVSHLNLREWIKLINAT